MYNITNNSQKSAFGNLPNAQHSTTVGQLNNKKPTYCWLY